MFWELEKSDLTAREQQPVTSVEYFNWSWNLMRGEITTRFFVEYMSVITKNWWVKCEETVEEDKCQLRDDKWQVSSELKNDVVSQLIQKMKLREKYFNQKW